MVGSCWIKLGGMIRIIKKSRRFSKPWWCGWGVLPTKEEDGRWVFREDLGSSFTALMSQWLDHVIVYDSSIFSTAWDRRDKKIISARCWGSIETVCILNSCMWCLCGAIVTALTGRVSDWLIRTHCGLPESPDWVQMRDQCGGTPRDL